MKFKGPPGMTVTIARPHHGEKKHLRFDENGFLEVTHPVTIKRMQANYQAVEEADTPPAGNAEDLPVACLCKKCGAEFENRRLLMAHYRKEHPKEN
jgi:hypothetical protein